MGRAPGYARTCRRGLHTIPAGVKYCDGCKRETRRLRGATLPVTPVNLPAYLREGMPSDDVLAEARCYPDIAYLFDPAESKRFGVTSAQTRNRHASAKAVCARCPVAEACYADALEHQRTGVYGGTVFTRGVPETALVQDVPGVQDSSAC